MDTINPFEQEEIKEQFRLVLDGESIRFEHQAFYNEGWQPHELYDNSFFKNSALCKALREVLNVYCPELEEMTASEVDKYHRTDADLKRADGSYDPRAVINHVINDEYRIKSLTPYRHTTPEARTLALTKLVEGVVEMSNCYISNGHPLDSHWFTFEIDFGYEKCLNWGTADDNEMSMEEAFTELGLSKSEGMPAQAQE